MQPAPLTTHDVANIDATWGEVIFTGIIEGDWGEVESLEDDTASQGGEDGSVVLNVNNDRRGRITIRLWNTSPTCLLLEAQRPRPGLPIPQKPLVVRNRNTGQKYIMPTAWLVRGIPNFTLSGQATPREFVFEGYPLEVTVG